MQEGKEQRITNRREVEEKYCKNDKQKSFQSNVKRAEEIPTICHDEHRRPRDSIALTAFWMSVDGENEFG